MRWFIVTDSDWEWSDSEGPGAGAFIGQAETPEDAAKAAVKYWARNDRADGGDLSVGEITLLGFIGFERVGKRGRLKWDEALRRVEGES